MRSKLSVVKAILLALLAIVLTFSTISPGFAATFTANTPIMITSAGQSPDAFVVKVLFDRAKISNDYDELASSANLKNT